jgi:hypothetical protein
MQYVPATQDSAVARSALLDIVSPVAVILVAGTSAGLWWFAELGRFWG